MAKLEIRLPNLGKCAKEFGTTEKNNGQSSQTRNSDGQLPLKDFRSH